MEYFAQQLVNGITLGSIYGLIAIGYTMVYGIIGMVNFAHGDVFMMSTFIALIFYLLVTKILGITSIALALLLVLILCMALTALWNWLIERLAYRPLRGSFRLAPLISAIGMSIFLVNLMQVVQGPTNKSMPPLVSGIITFGTSVVVCAETNADRHGHCGISRRVLVSRATHATRPRAARLRARHSHGLPAWHRRQPHHCDHLHHGRRAGGRRWPALRHPIRQRELRRWFCARREGLYRSRARRHRLAAGRRARRTA